MIHTDFLIVSFYYGDDYYYQRADELKKNLDRLNIPYEIEELQPASAEKKLNWIDITKEKIDFLSKKISAHKSKRIIWVDVDCQLNYIPEFLKSFSSDIIGFQRGFGHPLNIGYSTKKRFWEPSLLGFQCNEVINEYFNFMKERVSQENFSATDDYYFEEGWRKYSDRMSFQVIPSSLRHRRNTFINEEKALPPFFIFGSSGNVPTFMSKAKQHTSTPKEFKGLNVHDDILMAALSNQLIINYLTRIKQRFNSKKHAIAERLRGIFKAYPRKRKVITKLNQFEREADNSNIPLSWWVHPAEGNFGDFLSPYIISKLANRGVSYHPIKKPKILAIGSIAKFSQQNTIVWGSGISRMDTELNPQAKYLAVRGPLTREIIIKNGGVCPEIYGDPAIILPRIYNKPIEKKPGRIGLIRHTNHQSIKIDLPEGIEEYDIKLCSPTDIEKMIDWIRECDVLLSSAMHPHIVALSYEVPVKLITFKGFENSIPGDGMKFKDFYAGVNIDAPEIAVISKTGDLLNAAKKGWKQKIPEETIDKLISSFEPIKQYSDV